MPATLQTFSWRRRDMSDATASEPCAKQLQGLARLRSDMNGPLRSGLNTLSIATNLVAAEQARLRPRGQEALRLLCQEVEWHQLLWTHLLHSLDAVADAQQPPPLPARPSGRRP